MYDIRAIWRTKAYQKGVNVELIVNITHSHLVLMLSQVRLRLHFALRGSQGCLSSMEVEHYAHLSLLRLSFGLHFNYFSFSPEMVRDFHKSFWFSLFNDSFHMTLSFLDFSSILTVFASDRKKLGLKITDLLVFQYSGSYYTLWYTTIYPQDA